MNLYAVIDLKGKTIIGNIVHSINEVTIVRELGSAVNDPNSMISRHPQDFAIYKLGEINPENGEINAQHAEQIGPELITTALALKAATA